MILFFLISFFVDDVIFISEWSKFNIVYIVRMLHYFHLAYSLKINIHKSNLTSVSVQFLLVVEMAQYIGCAASKIYFPCLRLMLGTNMSRNVSWRSPKNLLLNYQCG